MIEKIVGDLVSSAMWESMYSAAVASTPGALNFTALTAIPKFHSELSEKWNSGQIGQRRKCEPYLFIT